VFGANGRVIPGAWEVLVLDSEGVALAHTVLALVKEGLGECGGVGEDVIVTAKLYYMGTVHQTAVPSPPKKSKVNFYRLTGLNKPVAGNIIPVGGKM